MSKRQKKPPSAFEKLQSALEDAIEYHRSRRVLTTREVEMPAPPRHLDAGEVSSVRKTLGVSQAVFARLLNVSAKTVQAWEIGAREPSDAALKLLHIAKKHPDILLEGFRRHRDRAA